jgi:flavin reductase (DIM6/NTAB) family NADH-FMN oxidoreductase RutF
LSSATSGNSSIITCELFRQACSKFATGITVVTTSANGSPHGLTVNSFTSVSCDPPLVSVSIDLKCSVLPALTNANYFGVNVLAEHQEDISVRFAGACDSRFEGIGWRFGATGVPVLDGAIAAFECRRHASIEAGDHVILLGKAELAGFCDGKPLLYFDRRYRRLSC